MYLIAERPRRTGPHDSLPGIPLLQRQRSMEDFHFALAYEDTIGQLCIYTPHHRVLGVRNM